MSKYFSVNLFIYQLAQVCVICLGLCYWFHINHEWVWLERRGPKKCVLWQMMTDLESLCWYWHSLPHSPLYMVGDLTLLKLLCVRWFRTQWPSLVWLCTSPRKSELYWTPFRESYIEMWCWKTIRTWPQQVRLPSFQYTLREWTYMCCPFYVPRWVMPIWTQWKLVDTHI